MDTCDGAIHPNATHQISRVFGVVVLIIVEKKAERERERERT
jgi:hypothetical protein